MNLAPYIGKSRARLQEVEAAIAAFDFAAGEQKAYQGLNREYQQLRRLMQAWDEQQKSLRELADNQAMLEGDEDEEFREVIAADIAALEGRIANLDREIKALILPPHPNEGRNTIVEIRPAAGGDEAALFAGDLYRMYLRFAEAKGWKIEELELAETAIGGVKGVAFTLQGDEVWGLMRYESGVHRVQRIPVTESGGRIHTSTVTVAVLAEAEEVDIQINNEDIRVDVFRSSGPGGQSVNTTDSAVRVTHMPTGLSVASQQEKSQHRNREIAMRILRSRLLEIRQLEEEQKSAAERRSQVGTGERSERIRTYNFPQNRITDHRYGLTLYDLTNVMEGQLDELLGEIRGRDAERRLELELTAQ